MKILSTSLLFMALASMFYIHIGQYMSLSAGITMAQSEVQTLTVDDAKTEAISFSAQDVAMGRATFISTSELRYYGQLYDIIRMDIRGDRYVLHVYHDKNEEGLIAEIGEAVSSWFSDTARDTSRHIKVIVTFPDYIPAGRCWFIFTDQFHALTIADMPRTFSIPVLDILKSPPRLV